MSGLTLHASENGANHIPHAAGYTVRLTQLDIAKRFRTGRQDIDKRLKAIVVAADSMNCGVVQ